MVPRIKKILDRLIDDQIGREEGLMLTDLEQVVLLLDHLFTKVEEQENHTHTLT